MRPNLAITAFGRLLRSSAVEIAVAEVDWDQLESSMDRRAIPPVFSTMLRAVAAPKPGFDGVSKLVWRRGSPSSVGRIPPRRARADPRHRAVLHRTHSLVDLGLDSLMALEFRNRMRTDLKATVSTAQLLQGPTLEALADKLAPQLSSSDALDFGSLAPDVLRPRLIAYLKGALAPILGTDLSAIVPTRSLAELELTRSWLSNFATACAPI